MVVKVLDRATKTLIEEFETAVEARSFISLCEKNARDDGTFTENSFEIKIERKTMWVCDHCLAAIESREGNQPILRHDIGLEYNEKDFEEMSRCDWCEENGFDTLYELI